MKKWNFPSANSIGIKGFNDIGEEFKDEPIQSLAKEICQNSLDTKFLVEYDKNAGPIKVSFNEFYIKNTEIPGYADFLNILEAEYNFNKELYKNDKTVPNFYKNAVEKLKNNKVRCLRISDFNTTGLLGSNKEDRSPWCDLTKNAGVSDKPEGSGGSKGKGKFASFICSCFYTVFYSTYAKDELKASCGIARLSGYQLEDGQRTLGEGYYENNTRFNGSDNCMNLDPNFQRTEYGTDIYILGFNEDYKDWREKIIASVIDNFFAAIVRKDLELHVDDYLLSSDTIATLINNETVKNYLNKKTRKYYEIMISEAEEIISESYSMFEPNDLILKIKIDEEKDAIDTVNTVAAIRSTGMKILDLKNLPKLGYYHGILEMNGTKVNDYFRKLENASHNKWSHERGENINEAQTRSENINEAKRRIDELKRFVKDSIRKNLTGKLLEEIDAEGVSEFLPDEEEYDNNKNDNGLETIDNEIIKEITIKEMEIKDKKSTLRDGGEEVELILDENGNIIKPHHKRVNPGPIPGPPNPNPLPNDEKRYSEVNRIIIPKKKRLIAFSNSYQILFSTNNDEEIIKISLQIYGENYKEKAKILRANARKTNKIINNKVDVEYFENNIILKNILKDEVYCVEFNLDTDEMWSLEVVVYGNIKE